MVAQGVASSFLLQEISLAKVVTRSRCLSRPLPVLTHVGSQLASSELLFTPVSSRLRAKALVRKASSERYFSCSRGVTCAAGGWGETLGEKGSSSKELTPSKVSGSTETANPGNPEPEGQEDRHALCVMPASSSSESLSQDQGDPSAGTDVPEGKDKELAAEPDILSAVGDAGEKQTVDRAHSGSLSLWRGDQTGVGPSGRDATGSQSQTRGQKYSSNKGTTGSRKAGSQALESNELSGKPALRAVRKGDSRQSKQAYSMSKLQAPGSSQVNDDQFHWKADAAEIDSTLEVFSSGGTSAPMQSHADNSGLGLTSAEVSLNDEGKVLLPQFKKDKPERMKAKSPFGLVESRRTEGLRSNLSAKTKTLRRQRPTPPSSSALPPSEAWETLTARSVVADLLTREGVPATEAAQRASQGNAYAGLLLAKALELDGPPNMWSQLGIDLPGEGSSGQHEKEKVLRAKVKWCAEQNKQGPLVALLGSSGMCLQDAQRVSQQVYKEWAVVTDRRMKAGKGNVDSQAVEFQEPRDKEVRVNDQLSADSWKLPTSDSFASTFKSSKPVTQLQAQQTTVSEATSSLSVFQEVLAAVQLLELLIDEVAPDVELLARKLLSQIENQCALGLEEDGDPDIERTAAYLRSFVKNADKLNQGQEKRLSAGSVIAAFPELLTPPSQSSAITSANRVLPTNSSPSKDTLSSFSTITTDSSSTDALSPSSRDRDQGLTERPPPMDKSELETILPSELRNEDPYGGELVLQLGGVLTFLEEQLGLARGEAAAAMLAFPPLMLLDPETELTTRLRMLKVAGSLPWKEVARLVGRWPWALAESLAEAAVPLMDFLYREALVRLRDLGGCLAGAPQLLACSLDRQLLPVVEFLLSAGVGSRRVQLGAVVARSPQALARSVEDLRGVVSFLEREAKVPRSSVGKVLETCPEVLATRLEVLRGKVQFLKRTAALTEDEVGRVVAWTPRVLMTSVENGLLPRVNFLKSLGLAKYEVGKMIVRFPPLLRYSLENNLRPKADYLIKNMGRSPLDLVEFPRFFSYDLELRILPRHLAAVKRGTFRADGLVGELLTCNDEVFHMVFIDRTAATTRAYTKGASRDRRQVANGAMRSSRSLDKPEEETEWETEEDKWASNDSRRQARRQQPDVDEDFNMYGDEGGW